MFCGSFCLNICHAHHSTSLHRLVRSTQSAAAYPRYITAICHTDHATLTAPTQFEMDTESQVAGSADPNADWKAENIPFPSRGTDVEAAVSWIPSPSPPLKKSPLEGMCDTWWREESRFSWDGKPPTYIGIARLRSAQHGDRNTHGLLTLVASCFLSFARARSVLAIHSANKVR